MPTMEYTPNRRILVIDDNTAIHADFKKTLVDPAGETEVFADAEAALFDETPAAAARPAVAEEYQIDFASQGRDGHEMVRAAVERGEPYALAFVDVRMPPGWDGVETIAKLWKLRYDNLSFRLYPVAFIEENKWRALRYGLDGKLIDFGKQRELPARELIREMLEWFLDDVLDELGSRKEVEYAFKILADGTSADRQLATFEKTGNLHSVVDQLIEETEAGVIA